MKVIDWIAVIGALAWLPHLISLLRDWLTSPELRVIAQPAPEIGFTSYGPICNVRLAFSVKHRDLVITGLRLKLTHESGEVQNFEWRGITQKMGQMSFPELGTFPIEKETSVLAIKVNEKDIEERFIRFQETSFLDGVAKHTGQAAKRLSYLMQQENFDVGAFLKSEEMTDLYSFGRQTYGWKPGSYSLYFQIESPDSFNVIDDTYEFSLSAIEVQQLEGNKAKLADAYANELIPKVKDEKKEAIVWNWVYPSMRKVI